MKTEDLIKQRNATIASIQDLDKKKDDFLSSYHQTKEDYEGILEALDKVLGRRNANISVNSNSKVPKTNIGIAIFVLRHARKPMHITEIWNAAVRLGAKSAAKDPINSLSTALYSYTGAAAKHLISHPRSMWEYK